MPPGHLGSKIGRHVAPGKAAHDCKPEGHRGIDVGTAHLADCTDDRDQDKAEGQSDRQGVVGGARRVLAQRRRYGHRGSDQDQQESPDQFGKHHTH